MTLALEFHGTKGGVGTTVTACVVAIYACLAHGEDVVLVVPDMLHADDVCAVLGRPSCTVPHGEVVFTSSGAVEHSIVLTTPEYLYKWQHTMIVTDSVVLHPSFDAQTWWVTRNDYLGLRRLARFAVDRDDPSFQVVGYCVEGGALRRQDIEHIAMRPIVSAAVDVVVGRAVDAGLLAFRMPDSLTAVARLVLDHAWKRIERRDLL